MHSDQNSKQWQKYKQMKTVNFAVLISWECTHPMPGQSSSIYTLEQGYVYYVCMLNPKATCVLST